MFRDVHAHGGFWNDIQKPLYFHGRDEEFLPKAFAHADCTVPNLVWFLDNVPVEGEFEVGEKEVFTYLSPETALAILQHIHHLTGDLALTLKTMLRKNVRQIIGNEVNWCDMPDFFEKALEQAPVAERLKLLQMVLELKREEMSGWVMKHILNDIATYILIRAGLKQGSRAYAVRTALYGALDNAEFNNNGAMEDTHCLEDHIKTVELLQELAEQS